MKTGPPEWAGAPDDAKRRLPVATVKGGTASEEDGRAEGHGASREESLAATDFRDLERAGQVRDIEALMRRFARRLKRLQLRDGRCVVAAVNGGAYALVPLARRLCVGGIKREKQKESGRDEAATLVLFRDRRNYRSGRFENSSED